MANTNCKEGRDEKIKWAKRSIDNMMPVSHKSWQKVISFHTSCQVSHFKTAVSVQEKQSHPLVLAPFWWKNHVLRFAFQTPGKKISHLSSQLMIWFSHVLHSGKTSAKSPEKQTQAVKYHRFSRLLTPSRTSDRPVPRGSPSYPTIHLL